MFMHINVILTTWDCDLQWPFQVLSSFRCWYEACLYSLGSVELPRLRMLCKKHQHIY